MGTKSGVQPVLRGPDGAPTYLSACPVYSGSAPPCQGKVLLEQPPAAGTTPGAVLGTGTFSMARGAVQNVTVTLTPAGKTALMAPKAVASVHVMSDAGPSANFGWQQVLGSG